MCLCIHRPVASSQCTQYPDCAAERRSVARCSMQPQEPATSRDSMRDCTDSSIQFEVCCDIKTCRTYEYMSEWPSICSNLFDSSHGHLQWGWAYHWSLVTPHCTWGSFHILSAAGQIKVRADISMCMKWLRFMHKGMSSRPSVRPQLLRGCASSPICRLA